MSTGVAHGTTMIAAGLTPRTVDQTTVQEVIQVTADAAVPTNESVAATVIEGHPNAITHHIGVIIATTLVTLPANPLGGKILHAPPTKRLIE